MIDSKINRKSVPLISVIVPIYNVEKYLSQCLDSIRNQTYKNMEIILVDDGSTDRCPQICDDYEKIDSRIKVIHKSNAGQGEARNSGMEIATGKYFAFVDSDDVVLPQMYEALFDSIVRTNSDVAACARIQIHENDGIPTINYELDIELEKIKVYTGREATKELLQGHRIFKNAVWDKLYKRELFDDIKFRSVYAEDREIMYKLLYSSKNVCYLGLKLYGYRQRQGSTMLSNWNDHKDEMVYEQDRQCCDFFLGQGDNELYTAAIYWHFLVGIENYRRLEGQDSVYRIRIKNEMEPYTNMKFLWNTDYPMRRKIEFYIFGKVPSVHYKICNIIRLLKERIKQ